MKRSSLVVAAALLSGAWLPARAAFPGPNGRIAYAYEGAIHTVKPNGSDAREVVDGANPAFSPDGSRLVFSCGGQICLVDTDGTNQEQLTTDPTFRSQQPHWSPSGDRIVFTRREIVGSARGPSSIFLIGADGTDESALDERGNDPVWSPDGKWIAFTKGNQGDGLYLIRPDGTDRRRLIDARNYIHSLSWSPESRSIAFTMQFRNFWRIWLIRRDGSRPREIFRGSGRSRGGTEVSGRGLSWSPDGKRIVYYNIKKDRLCFVRSNNGRRAGCLEHSGERPDWAVRRDP